MRGPGVDRRRRQGRASCMRPQGADGRAAPLRRCARRPVAAGRAAGPTRSAGARSRGDRRAAPAARRHRPRASRGSAMPIVGAPARRGWRSRVALLLPGPLRRVPRRRRRAPAPPRRISAAGCDVTSRAREPLRATSRARRAARRGAARRRPRPLRRGGPEPADLAGLERPLVGFVGPVDDYVDVAALRGDGRPLERGTVVLVGATNVDVRALWPTPRRACWTAAVRHDARLPRGLRRLPRSVRRARR